MRMIKHGQLLLAVLAASATGGALASSHREAPFISTRPSVDGTDFYMFNSYEAGRAGYVTLLANYIPLQDPSGGPNYFNLDDNALYEISIDNTGAGAGNLTFQFRFTTTIAGLAVPAGSKMVPVPLANIGALNAGATGVQNVSQSYTLTLVTGDRRTGTATPITNATTGSGHGHDFPAVFQQRDKRELVAVHGGTVLRDIGGEEDHLLLGGQQRGE